MKRAKNISYEKNNVQKANNCAIVNQVFWFTSWHQYDNGVYERGNEESGIFKEKGTQIKKYLKWIEKVFGLKETDLNG